MTTTNKNSNALFSETKFCLVFVIVFLMVMGVSACSKRQAIAPKLTPEPTNLRFVGKFVWFDLFTHDLQSASHFYKELFGWSFYPAEAGGKFVKTIIREGVPIANAIQINRKKNKINESRWLGYISVENVDRSAKLVEQNNGTIYMRPKELPNRGRVAVVMDPQGAAFAIVTALGGDPPDQGIMENFWMGSELWTSRMDSALKFYRLLVGYEQKLVDVGTDSKYCLLVKDIQPRAGMVKILWDDVKPNWVPYIAVEDVMAIADKAKQLGGILLIEPDKKVREGMVAIISDPNGAVFGVQQLSGAASMGEESQ
ncbi:MAG: VOC family protein [Desulfobacterales bacterium]|nr:VOC family protein [Desulfobacterales bacterium]